jgi:hypothetical protein
MTGKSAEQLDVNRVTRQQLIELVKGGSAHATFEEAIKDLPAAHRGTVVEGLPYSIWQLVEHIRIAQWDILEYSRNQNHHSPKWPQEYWSKQTAPADDNEWKSCVLQIKTDRDKFISLLNDLKRDLFEPFSYGGGQNLLREALLIADHTSYHAGQIVIIRRLLGLWKAS